MSDITTADGVEITVRDDIAMVQLAARRGASADLEAKAQAVFGIGLPGPSKAVEHDGKTIVWAGPDQWLVVQDDATGLDALADIQRGFAGLASAVDVGDSRVAVVVTGASAQRALAKVIPVDLHDKAFAPGSVAITQCFHLGITLWRASSGTAFTLLCARTYAADFLRHLRHALQSSAGEN